MKNQRVRTLSDIDTSRYPGIDLNERSSRPGVDGPRYVITKDGGLGDTNTGRHVVPVNGQPEHSEQYRRAVARAELFRQQREVFYGGGD